MLNDLKDWAIEKKDETVQRGAEVASEIQGGDIMEWSGTVWIVIGVVVALMVIGAASKA